jgi:hypothetical protein
MKRKTNFDLYLEEQLKDRDFAGRGHQTGFPAQGIRLVPERTGKTGWHIPAANQPP